MDYQLIDSGDFTKLEQFAGYKLLRPAPAAVWRRQEVNARLWRQVDAVLTRKSGGDGEWNINNPKLKEPWTIELLGLRLEMRLTSFGHLGIFPEQHDTWIEMAAIVEKLANAQKTKPKVLNLFAYTGIGSLICARAGAEVTHVDASKTSVSWARKNAELSGLTKEPVRWIVEDVQEFVGREVRRGNRYQGIILDPPSFGRGHKNQLWKIEKHLLPLLDDLAKLLADQNSFVCLSSHTPGYTPLALENLLRDAFESRAQSGKFTSREMTLRDKAERYLPSGTCALYTEI